MAYFTLQFKKVVKSTLTILGIGLILLLLFDILYQNSRSGTEFSTLEATRENLVNAKQNIKRAKADLNKYPKNSKNYRITKKEYDSQMKIANSSQTIINAIKTHDWHTAYKLLIWQDQQLLVKAKKADGRINPDFKAATNNEILRFKSLDQANLAEESATYPTTGFLYTLSTFEYIMPILLILVVVFVLTKLLAAKYVDRLDTSSLYPMRNVQVADLFAATIIGWLILAVIILLVFSVASVVFGTGAANYPTSGINLQTGKAEYLPLIQRLLPTLGLTLLALAFTAAVVLLVVQIFKSQLTSLLIAALVLIGGTLLSELVVPFEKIAQYFPTTYFYSLRVVNGDLATKITNKQVNFANGVIVLLVWTLALILLNLLWSRLNNKVKE